MTHMSFNTGDTKPLHPARRTMEIPTHLSYGIYHKAKRSQNKTGAMIFLCPEMGSKGVLGQSLSCLSLWVPAISTHVFLGDLS